MEAWVLFFFIFSFFSILANHSCQVPPNRSNESLSPIIILPAPSRISYESLHYPVPMDQQYQVMPLVINTGKIPLINHAVQASLQYFAPLNNDNRRAPIYDSVQYSTDRDERLQLRRNPNTSILYSNDEQTENRPTYRGYGNDNNHPPAATATVYSETRIDGPPYSYGYKIIDDHVGDSNDRYDAPTIVDGDRPTSYNKLSDPDETDGVFEHKIGPGAGPRAVANGRKPGESDDRRDGGPDNIPRALKPIVIKTESNTTKTELKKYYKKVTNPETPVKEAKQNGKLTTINPAQR
ncbi:uncharacterized protein LOC100570753 [Acyrthosiphon pisum]|uniref:Uncharacterized protein n=1 Tax=Acyrthosiphon pisum TaxID=7029 RepID=A0A8R1W5J3_ACYPI|nr:uncharacterized protein LOC100570753 [Acyrthosiphon pisum]|eukprot:XP_003244496.1 PREDICTED: uncharacterized protein LOC100570753 [Acyrthosiphon pisum]